MLCTESCHYTFGAKPGGSSLRNTMSEKPSRESAFKAYLDTNFPPNAKRTRSAVIRKKLAQKIINYLKGTCTDIGVKAFRHFVKSSGFELLDLPSLGIRDALVVKLKQPKQVCVCNTLSSCAESNHILYSADIYNYLSICFLMNSIITLRSSSSIFSLNFLSSSSSFVWLSQFPILFFSSSSILLSASSFPLAQPFVETSFPAFQ